LNGPSPSNVERQNSQFSKPRPMSAAQPKPDVRPRRRRLRPSSTSGLYQSSSSDILRQRVNTSSNQKSPYAPDPYSTNHNPYSTTRDPYSTPNDPYSTPNDPYSTPNNPYLSTHSQMLIQAKRFNSMHDLNGSSGRQPIRVQSSISMDQVGLRRTTSLSDRIDSFLQAVHNEEEQHHQQQLQLQQQRQAQLNVPRGRTSSNRPSMSSVGSAGNISSRKASTTFSVSSLPSKHHYQLQRPTIRPRTVQEVPRPPRPQRQAESRPQMNAPTTKTKQLPNRQRRPLAKPPRKTATPTPAPIDTNNIVSKLKQDRNYQPPRHKRQPPVHLQENSRQMIQRQQSQHQSSSDNGEDYEDDFEAEEELEEDDDTDTAMMRKKQAWLYDQFRRVRARQRAALMVKRQESGAEKASSKDSAYGYSGGETSRLHTREPTPDYQQLHGAALSRSSQQGQQSRPVIKQRVIPSSSGSHRVHHGGSPQSNPQRSPLVPRHMTEAQGKSKVRMTCRKI
jgi:hypothetical protein